MGRVTAADVARDLGVSPYHAQRTLGSWKGYGVPKEIQGRVRARAAEMGYEPQTSNLRRFTDRTAPKRSPRMLPHPGIEIE